MVITMAKSINNLGVTRWRDLRADDIDAGGDQSQEKEQSRLMAREPRSLIVNELGTPFECHICGRSFGVGRVLRRHTWGPYGSAPSVTG